MSDSKTPQEKIQAVGASVSGTVNEAFHDARPAFNRMADRVSESLHDMAQHGKETALQAEHRIEREAMHARHMAEHYIQHAPLKSVLIAAGTGAATALVMSWLMHQRKH